MRDDIFLRDCLVDGERETKARSRRVRQRAVGTALIFEAALVCGLALWPLLTPGTPPPETITVARIPLRGLRMQRPVRGVVPPSKGRTVTLNFSPSPISPQVLRQVPPGLAPNVDVSGVGDLNLPVSTGAGVLFGSGTDALPIAPPSPTRPTVPVIRRSENVQESQLIFRVVPVYPQIARNARISGTVELMVLVGRDGKVISVHVLSGSPLLVGPAKQAVEQWRYRPAVLDGEGAVVEARVTVTFVLNE